MSTCEYCKTEVKNDGKLFPNRKWLSGGNTLYLGSESWLHNDCQKENWKNIVTGLSFLDQPLNDCRFFVRDGHSMNGWYEREGKRFPGLLWAGIDLYTLDCSSPRYLTTPNYDIISIDVAEEHSLVEFKEWLIDNGWWPNWWEHRKEEVYSDEILKKRTNI